MAGDSQKVWSYHDVVALLAWLEFCIQNKLDFSKTIESHLENVRSETTGVQHFSLRQVRNKLGDLSKNTYGLGQNVPLARILKDGKQCFTNLPARVDAEINTTMATYKTKYDHMLDNRVLDEDLPASSKETRSLESRSTTLDGSVGSQTLSPNSIFLINISHVFNPDLLP